MEENLLEGKGVPYEAKIHRILAHSYSFYFVSFFAGVILDLIFRIKIFENSTLSDWGFGLIIASSLLIIWAQSTSRNLRTENLSADNFYHGPYCFTRSPTHWGLFFLMLGFSIVTNGLFTIIFTAVSFVVTKAVFLKKEEDALAEKYGGAYLDYKKKVRL